MNLCPRCGVDVGDENPEVYSCGKCPPTTCDRCGGADDRSCSCWLPFEGMNLADLKAVFAPYFDIQPNVEEARS
jgi:hypothetical protein